MEARMSIMFYGKKTKNESDKILTIYLRVTINGERYEVSTHVLLSHQNGHLKPLK